MSNPSRRLDDWLEKNPSLARKVVIPASLKWEVRDKLDQSGVNERMRHQIHCIFSPGRSSAGE